MFHNIIKVANNSNVINNNYPAIEKIIPISAEAIWFSVRDEMKSPIAMNAAPKKSIAK